MWFVYLLVSLDDVGLWEWIEELVYFVIIFILFLCGSFFVNI